MTEGGGTNPREAFVGVFESAGSKPFALSVASRSTGMDGVAEE